VLAGAAALPAWTDPGTVPELCARKLTGSAASTMSITAMILNSFTVVSSATNVPKTKLHAHAERVDSNSWG
jgi:hypothetical protein